MLVAFNYATFFMAVALLVGMVCLLLLGRSAAAGGLAHVTAPNQQKRPIRDVLAAVLAAESALVGLGGIVSFVLYASLAASLPDAGVGHMLAELAVLPVVTVTLLWGWAGGISKLKRLFGVGSPVPTPEDHGSVTGPPGPPAVAAVAPDRQALASRWLAQDLARSGFALRSGFWWPPLFVGRRMLARLVLGRRAQRPRPAPF